MRRTNWGFWNVDQQRAAPVRYCHGSLWWASTSFAADAAQSASGAHWLAIALYVDFEKGGGNALYEYNMLTHGPVIGVIARF